jgi:hypothetical protein
MRMNWIYFIKDPAFYLRQGRENFLNNELKSSALDLRTGHNIKTATGMS